MKEKDLFRAMTDIDDKFVLEASPDNVHWRQPALSLRLDLECTG